jgi:hypothetical protein
MRKSSMQGQIFRDKERIDKRIKEIILNRKSERVAGIFTRAIGMENRISCVVG